MAPSPKSRLTAVRLEAEGVSAAEVEMRLRAAYFAIDPVLGGDGVYGAQVIEQEHEEYTMKSGDGSVVAHHVSTTTFKGRAKIWPNTADDAPQHELLSGERLAAAERIAGVA